ncbi:hypothetical protein HAZT_HAZT003398 [Hyalella azteca]|uniref:DUF3456 domain-containing protein n=1 Tax=Hyalella azteca TaxID=294128 RepID=A0A6A0H425_HYAAZ|nr:hypothetical protein HAZT_HAZT003398 [Hyalella azteca]
MLLSFQVVKCAVCQSLVNEVHYQISQVDPRRKIEVGSYRIASNGDQQTTSRIYAGSEAHMTELMETVCGSFKDYAQAKHKETGRVEVIPIVGKDGQMNPRFSEYEMIQDPDLNKSLEFHCESIVEDHEDDIVEHFSSQPQQEFDLEKSQKEFCWSKSKICSGFKEEL